mgnify:CR=1 FL=1
MNNTHFLSEVYVRCVVIWYDQYEWVYLSNYSNSSTSQFVTSYELLHLNYNLSSNCTKYTLLRTPLIVTISLQLSSLWKKEDNSKAMTTASFNRRRLELSVICYQHLFDNPLRLYVDRGCESYIHITEITSSCSQIQSQGWYRVLYTARTQRYCCWA